MKKNLTIRKHSVPLLVSFFLTFFCLSSLSCTPSSSYFQYELKQTDSSYHFQKITSLPCQIQNQKATLHAAIIDGGNSSQLVVFTTDPNGTIMESVAFTPLDNLVLNSDILCWFPTQHSTYIVYETMTIENYPIYQLHFLEIDSNALQNSVLQDVTTFFSANVSLHNVCTISNHIFVSGSYNADTSKTSYGLIVEFIETEPSQITLHQSSLLHIPTNKNQQSTKAICSIIPDVSLEKDVSSLHFSTRNGFIGMFHPTDGTKNCYSVPGYYPSFQNRMFSNGENILLENHPKSSYDADLIQVHYNGKTDHIHLFNQYPDLSYQWIAKKRPHDGSLGMLVLGFQKNNDMFLVGEMDSSYASIQGWFTQNRYQMRKLSNYSTENDFLLIEGFFSPIKSSSDGIQTHHPCLEYIKNPWQISRWKPSLQRMKKNYIPNPDKAHLYYNDQQNNTLDLKKTQREVEFVKPFRVSDMTGKVFQKGSLSIVFEDFDPIRLRSNQKEPRES